MKNQFKEDVIKAAREQAKSRISQEDLERLNPNINHFVYLTGYSAKTLEEKVDIVVSALPDEFFKQTFQKTKIKTASLIAEELLSTHYNLSSDNEFLNFLYELVDKIAGLFKESAVESLTGKSIEPIAKIDKNRSEEYSQDLYNRLLDGEDLKVVTSEAITYLEYLIKQGDLLHLDDLKRGDPGERIECIDRYLKVAYGIIIALKAQPDNKDLISASELIKSNIAEFKVARAKLEIYTMAGKKGDVVQPNSLTKRQELALKLLTQANRIRTKAIHGPQLTAEQKVFVQDFIKDSMGNMKLNGALSYLSTKGELAGLSSTIVEEIRDLTYRTRNYDIFLSANQKFNRNYNDLLEGKPENIRDKVNLREYGILMSYAKAQDTFELLNTLGIIDGDVKLQEIFEEVKRLGPRIAEVNERIQSEVVYESGDIMMNNLQKESELTNKKLKTPNELARLFITEHMHTLKMFVDDISKKQSHMTTRGVFSDAFDINRYLLSDLYNIKVDRLLIDKFKSKLESKYGPKYANTVDEIYRKIEFDIHKNSQAKFQAVRYRPVAEVAKAGLADFLPFLGHTKINPDNLDKLHTKMMADIVEADEMICSEFAARTTAVAFIELNKRLQTALETTENVIEIPFDARERFSKIHPDRLLKILAAKGCIEEAPRTKTENQFITFAGKVKATTSAQLNR